MKISVIIPIGDADAWARGQKSIHASIALVPKDVEFEVLPCLDLESYILTKTLQAYATDCRFISF